MNNGIAFYGGSFDPFTEGHRLCLCHAITNYDRVIVGVGRNPDKSVLLSPEQRVLLIKDALADFISMYKYAELIGKEFSLVEKMAAERLISYPDCVKVIVYEGLTVDAAIKNEAFVLIRGERLVGDHDAEMQLAHINNELCKIRGYDLQTVIFPVSQIDLTYVSSTVVKNLMNEGEYIAAMKYVMPCVHNFLCEQMLKNREYKQLTSGNMKYCGDLVRSYRKYKYHNFSHVAYMLNFLNIFCLMQPKVHVCKTEIMMATFWHDFEQRGENPEERSAEMASYVARYCLGYSDLVNKLVLATDHKNNRKLGEDINLDLIHDLDLAILGDEQNYGRYSWSVMQEYTSFEGITGYSAERIKFLDEFLSRKRIYKTDYFYNRFEKIARQNMKREKLFWQGAL